MRKSPRETKPSAKFLESQGVEIDGYTPSELPDVKRMKGDGANKNQGDRIAEDGTAVAGHASAGVVLSEAPVAKRKQAGASSIVGSSSNGANASNRTVASQQQEQQQQSPTEQSAKSQKPSSRRERVKNVQAQVAQQNKGQEDPLARRCRTIEIHRGQLKRLLDRICKWDRYGFFIGSDLGGVALEWENRPTFGNVQRKMENGDYFYIGLDEEDWITSRAALKQLEKRGLEGRKELKREDFLYIDYDKFEQDVCEVTEFILARVEPDETDDVRNLAGAAKRLHESSKENIAHLRNRQSTELEEVLNEESLDRLSLENREPAMRGWRKKPFEPRQYNMINFYKSVEGLTREEGEEMMAKLECTEKENCWIPTPGVDFGFDDVDPNLLIKGKKKNSTVMTQSWTTKQVGRDVIETDTWGIDPFARRNILIALETIKEPNLRMSQPQIQWFIEGILLREINAQPSDIAYDITNSLHAIKRKAQEEIDIREGRITVPASIEGGNESSPEQPDYDNKNQENSSEQQDNEVEKMQSEQADEKETTTYQRTELGSASTKDESSDPKINEQRLELEDRMEDPPASKVSNFPPVESRIANPSVAEASIGSEKLELVPSVDENPKPEEGMETSNAERELGTNANSNSSLPQESSSEVMANTTLYSAKDIKAKEETQQNSATGDLEEFGMNVNQNIGNQIEKKADEGVEKITDEFCDENEMKLEQPDIQKEKKADNVSNQHERNVEEGCDVLESIKVEPEQTFKKKTRSSTSTKKRKRTLDLDVSNVLWTSTRSRKKPDFFEAVPKVPKIEQENDDEDEMHDDDDGDGGGGGDGDGFVEDDTIADIDLQNSNNRGQRKRTRKGRARRLSSSSFPTEAIASTAPNPLPRKATKAKSSKAASSKSRKRKGSKAGRPLGKRSKKQVQVAEEPEDDGLVGSRISVFRPSACAWFWGRIIEYCANPEEEGKHHHVQYDDGKQEWIDIKKQRCVFENRRETMYDKFISPEARIAGVDVLLSAQEKWGQHNFCIHPKGTGVVSVAEVIPKGDLVGSYYGELYPLWLWEQKESREDSQRKQAQRGGSGKVTLPDFWNMRFEIPPESEDGMFMMYADAKYNGSFTSRLSHSCRPNCTTMLAIINGSYHIAVRAVRDIEKGEELCIDYNCVTDSIDEFRAAICLCGSEGCRGSFLYITGAQQYVQVVNRRHRTIHRIAMLFEASLDSPLNLKDGHAPTAALNGGSHSKSSKKSKRKSSASSRSRRKSSSTRSNPRRRGSAAAKNYCDDDYLIIEDFDPEAEEDSKTLGIDVKDLDAESRKRLIRFGLKKNALENLPHWLLRYCALVLRFIELEQLELPARLFYEELNRRQALAADSGGGLNESATKEAPKSSKGGSGGSGGKFKISDSLDQGVVTDLWENVQRESKGIALQRVSHLLIALSKIRHRIDSRIRLGHEGAAQQLTEAIMNIDSNKLGKFGASSPRDANSGVQETRIKALVVESDVKQMERVWWIGDRCEAKWCGDDAASYPGWYSGTILQVHHEGLKGFNFSEMKNDRARLVDEPSVHFLYDDGGIVDRIPMSEEVLRRPSLEAILIKDDEEIAHLPPKEKDHDEEEKETQQGIEEEILKDDLKEHFTGLSLGEHQSPFRPLSDAEIADALWRHKTNSVVRRLLRMLESFCCFEIKEWQCVDNPQLKHPYWWNVESREVTKNRPNTEQCSRTVTFVPGSISKIRKMVENRKVNSAADARKALEIVRDLLLQMPSKRVRSDLMLEQDDWLEEAHQKAIDLLTFYTCTKNFFDVLESPPVKQQLHPWRTSLVTRLKEIARGQEERRRADDIVIRQISSTFSVHGNDAKNKLEETNPTCEGKNEGGWKSNSQDREERGKTKFENDQDDCENDPESVGLERTSKRIGHGLRRPKEVRFNSFDEEDENKRVSNFLGINIDDHHHHESSIIASILGWLDQKEENLDVRNLLGSSMLPEIECAYSMPKRPRTSKAEYVYPAHYSNLGRQKLLKQLADRTKRYEEWDSEVKDCFPDTPPCLEEGAVDAWPPPLPPTKLYGSPVMDAAIADNRDYTRLSLSLGGSIQDLYESKLLEELERPASNRGSAIFGSLINSLKSLKRGGTAGSSNQDLDLSPPAPPTVEQCTWIQCESCEKWRKLPNGMNGKDFKGSFYCEQLAEVDPAFASCSIAEEGIPRGESLLKWGSGISNVDDLKVGHRIDAFCQRQQAWFAVDIVDAKPESVCVEFPKKADLPEDQLKEWILRQPLAGELPKLNPLYSFTNKADDEKRLHQYIEVERAEMSKFGRKATTKDYAMHFNGMDLQKNIQNSVLAVVADLVNRVSDLGGEPLGRVKVKVKVRHRKKSQVKSPAPSGNTAEESTAEPTMSYSRARQQHRDTTFQFFKEMKSLSGGQVAFQDVMKQADLLTEEQYEMWNPSLWQGTPFASWMDDVFDEDLGVTKDNLLEEDEQFVLEGMVVETPFGKGVVVNRTGPRKYLVAVQPPKDMEVETHYGRGTVIARDEESGNVTVKLSFGVCYLPDFSVLVELFFAIPLQPFLMARAMKLEIEDALAKKKIGKGKQISDGLDSPNSPDGAEDSSLGIIDALSIGRQISAVSSTNSSICSENPSIPKEKGSVKEKKAGSSSGEKELEKEIGGESLQDDAEDDDELEQENGEEVEDEDQNKYDNEDGEDEDEDEEDNGMDENEDEDEDKDEDNEDGKFGLGVNGDDSDLDEINDDANDDDDDNVIDELDDDEN